MDMNDQTLQYTIILQASEEGGYIAFAPALPGCMTQGETLDEAKENITDAIGAYLEVLREDGDKIPRETKTPLSFKVSIPLRA
jgi:predicted RNase H-like HicB family nuclease